MTTVFDKKLIGSLEELRKAVEKMKELDGKSSVVDILGTEYSIHRQSSKENPKLEGNNGICEQYSKEIILNTLEEEKRDVMCVENVEEFEKKTLRHEIIHAYLGESGLRSSSEWAENEEMVDWFAIQLPKIFKTFKELDVI